MQLAFLHSRFAREAEEADTEEATTQATQNVDTVEAEQQDEEAAEVEEAATEIKNHNLVKCTKCLKTTFFQAGKRSVLSGAKRTLLLTLSACPMEQFQAC